jgi:hypothetical protein
VSASDEIAGLTRGELTSHYKAGALTPLEATLAIFARIEQLSILFMTLSPLYENASNHDPAAKLTQRIDFVRKDTAVRLRTE